MKILSYAGLSSLLLFPSFAKAQDTSYVMESAGGASRTLYGPFGPKGRFDFEVPSSLAKFNGSVDKTFGMVAWNFIGKAIIPSMLDDAAKEFSHLTHEQQKLIWKATRTAAWTKIEDIQEVADLARTQNPSPKKNAIADLENDLRFLDIVRANFRNIMDRSDRKALDRAYKNVREDLQFCREDLNNFELSDAQAQAEILSGHANGHEALRPRQVNEVRLHGGRDLAKALEGYSSTRFTDAPAARPLTAPSYERAAADRNINSTESVPLPQQASIAPLTTSNRDSSTQRVLSRLPFATATLVTINAAIFAAEPYLDIRRWALQPIRFSQVHGIREFLGQAATLLSSMFLHANLGHLLENMFSLAAYGVALELLSKRSRLLAIFFTAGLASNLLEIALHSHGWQGKLYGFGASDAVAGLMGAFAYLFLRQNFSKDFRGRIFYGISALMSAYAALFFIDGILGIVQGYLNPFGSIISAISQGWSDYGGHILGWVVGFAIAVWGGHPSRRHQ